MGDKFLIDILADEFWEGLIEFDIGVREVDVLWQQFVSERSRRDYGAESSVPRTRCAAGATEVDDLERFLRGNRGAELANHFGSALLVLARPDDVEATNWSIQCLQKLRFELFAIDVQQSDKFRNHVKLICFGISSIFKAFDNILKP